MRSLAGAALRGCARPRPRRRLSTYSRAVVRAIAPTFASGALRGEAQGRTPIDQALAEAQHEVYCRVLEERASLRLHRLEADARLPDCVFVEDTAVVAGERAVVCRPGHAARRGEEEATRAALEGLLEGGEASVGAMRAPAACDGGDVIADAEAGLLLVGLSARTTRAGAEALRDGLGQGMALETLEVPGGRLHLKSVATLVGRRTLAVSEDACDALRPRFEALGYGVLPTDPAGANNVLANGVLLVSAASQAPFEGWAAAGRLPGVREVVRVDTSELAKADGALTCCSLLLR